ncbi:ABC transporter permease [Microbacterium sp. zg.Y909]|uniref:ABC transporter permease n=1 Tax=Microbacterium sp. zg.Y909 TaxID=2969413 RepID=UPI00214B035F|nr:ABC transporter permease [Microbacterium sp. zg.Y909]MCR2824083.1 ABC transporter permease [Microbacterium sp. zg.Y909]
MKISPTVRRRRRMGPLVAFSIVWLALVALAALTALVVPMNGNSSDTSAIAKGPSMAHLLGTDQLGRDILTRLMQGAANTATVVVGAAVLAILIGVTAGIVSGYKRGVPERTLSILSDAVLAFPTLVLVMVLVALYGASAAVLVVGLGIAMSPTFLRLARAGTLTFRSREFVTASIVLGVPPGRVMRRDILPNIFPAVLAYSFVVMGILAIAEGSLSYLGFGIPSAEPSWGNMIASGRTVMVAAPHVVLIPSLVLFLTVMSLNLVGEYLQQRRSVVRVTVGG